MGRSATLFLSTSLGKMYTVISALTPKLTFISGDCSRVLAR